MLEVASEVRAQPLAVPAGGGDEGAAVGKEPRPVSDEGPGAMSAPPRRRRERESSPRSACAVPPSPKQARSSAALRQPGSLSKVGMPLVTWW
jgi:hypothetical protein